MEDRKMSECSGNCSSCSSKEKSAECALNARLATIKHKIVVMSGKGGVGKSTVSVNLAKFLAASGKKVGLLDVDLHGPSLPEMLGAADVIPDTDGNEFFPIETNGILLMSVGLLLDRTDAPVVWRGPMKISVIKQLLTDVKWGELDYLIIDCPPGTGDEPLSVCQLITDADGAVIVTTPQNVAASDVARSINFCRQINYNVLGIVENMSGFVCPDCGKVTDIFSSGAGERLAKDYNVELLGKLPLDPKVCMGGDSGNPFTGSEEASPVKEAFAKVGNRIIELTDK